jgi:ABC-2 type transport system ATP-binding protein
VLASALSERGFEARGEGSVVHVGLDGTEPYDAIRDCIVELDLGLVRLEQRRQSLEDIFRPPELEEVAGDV